MLRRLLFSYKTDCSGATAVEYGLLAAGLALAIAGVSFVIGDDLLTLFNVISGAFSSAFES